MSAEFQSTAVDVLSRNAGAVSAGTIATGTLTIIDVLPTILGCVASFLGILLTGIVIANKRKEGRILDIRIKNLEEANRDS